MGTWPDLANSKPNGMTHFGPLSALGGINTEMCQNFGWGWNSQFTVSTTNARFFPFLLQDPIVPNYAAILCGATVSGAWTVAIVDEFGTRMCTTSANTAVSNAFQTATFSATRLTPGKYYVGWQNSTGSGTYIGCGTPTIPKMRAMGCRSANSSLAATNTLVAYSDTTPIPLMILSGLVNT